MDLQLHESVLLLGLDDEKGHFTVDGAYLYYGFAAALIMDLILEERIVIEEERVKMKTNAILDNKLLNEVLRYIRESKKVRRVSHWLHYTVQRINKLKPLAIDHLIQQNILKKEEKKVLWIFKDYRYPSVDLQPENALRHRLRQIIFEDVPPTSKERMLLAVILSCQLYNDLFPKKEERKKAKTRIKALTQDSEMKKLLGNAINEMQVILMLTTGSIV